MKYLFKTLINYAKEYNRHHPHPIRNRLKNFQEDPRLLSPTTRYSIGRLKTRQKFPNCKPYNLEQASKLDAHKKSLHVCPEGR